MSIPMEIYFRIIFLQVCTVLCESICKQKLVSGQRQHNVWNNVTIKLVAKNPKTQKRFLTKFYQRNTQHIDYKQTDFHLTNSNFIYGKNSK